MSIPTPLDIANRSHLKPAPEILGGLDPELVEDIKAFLNDSTYRVERFRFASLARIGYAYERSGRTPLPNLTALGKVLDSVGLCPEHHYVKSGAEVLVVKGLRLAEDDR